MIPVKDELIPLIFTLYFIADTPLQYMKILEMPIEVGATFQTGAVPELAPVPRSSFFPGYTTAALSAPSNATRSTELYLYSRNARPSLNIPLSLHNGKLQLNVFSFGPAKIVCVLHIFGSFAIIEDRLDDAGALSSIRASTCSNSQLPPEPIKDGLDTQGH